MHSILPPHLATSHSLPDFRSLIIQGCYPPSAPIHLCLSHLSSGLPTNKALLLSSSNLYLSSELEEYNDAWLAQHAGSGTVAELLHQIDIFYPPTHRHLRLLLARLRTYSTPEADANSENDLKTCLARPPTLLVLHELSRYFLSPQLLDGSEIQEIQLPTLSTYMQLVVDAIAALQFLSRSASSSPPRLVIFDKELYTLALPLLRPVNLADITKLPKQHKAYVANALQRYIGWIGTVEIVEDEEVASSQTDEIEIVTQDINEQRALGRTRFRMTLCKSPHATTKPGVAHEQTFEWHSYRDPYEPPFTPRRQTIVVSS